GDFTDLYPIQKVNIRVGPPAMLPSWSSSAAFALLRDRKMTEMAKPWEYYHMIANAQNNSAGTATSGRIAFTITRTPNIDGNTNTFAHEIGHNHGLSHMPGCGASGSDNSYPYVPNMAPEGVTWPAGFMGVNGYSISTNTFKSSAMFRELMSYCRPRWISDYVYNKFEARVRQTMAMIPAGMADEDMSKRSLQGWAGPGENINFGLALGQLVDEATTPITDHQHAVLTLTDGRTIKVPVAIGLASDDVTREFAINLDTDQTTSDEVVRAEVFVGGERTVVDVVPMLLKNKR
ncbi:MAG TPA: M66 family metalloprotease, partial [Polyangia bacterium]